MATTNRNKNHRMCNKNQKWSTDFTRIGGLSSHLKLLREIIIFPLLYGDLFRHFNLKSPRGVLFFGPPGTGKTLVAGALATELNREGNGKVAFFQRKGADILDKWVGESERKLRELFEKAARSRPSVIFFDELDGLAPERSQKNDQVHCSIVATLLALMDGLDNTPGVIVIGATNRIDAIDPALRRPGRFDRELYFPLPTTAARREILEVHTRTWTNIPCNQFLGRLSELTTGCCGSDLQALCAEAVLCCLRRLYPNINKPNIGKLSIDVNSVEVEESDFLIARLNLVPAVHRRETTKQRTLSPFIAPLLKRQLDRVQRHLNVFLPHFTQPGIKYMIGSERYAGRLVLKGTNQHGLNTHLVPAILHAFEHLPSYILDVPTLFEKNITTAQQNLPSILVLSRVDDWWDLIESNIHMLLTALLEDFHAGLPLLIIATCAELPDMLHEYFYKNSSIVIQIESPQKNEREEFFDSLFFNTQFPSVQSVWNKVASKEEKPNMVKEETNYESGGDSVSVTLTPPKRRYNTRNSERNRQRDLNVQKAPRNLKRKSSLECVCESPKKKFKAHNLLFKLPVDHKYRKKSRTKINYAQARAAEEHEKRIVAKMKETMKENSKEYMNTLGENLKHRSKSHLDIPRNSLFTPSKVENESKDQMSDSVPKIKIEPTTSLQEHHYCFGDNKLMDRSGMEIVWQRLINVTSAGLQVTQLELLYDMIKGCIYIYPDNYGNLIRGLEEILENFEKSV